MEVESIVSHLAEDAGVGVEDALAPLGTEGAVNVAVGNPPRGSWIVLCLQCYYC
jgi:hypothetical protein